MDNKDVYTAVLINAWHTAQMLYFTQHGRLEDDDKERLFIDILGQAHRLQSITENTAGFNLLDKAGRRDAVRAMLGIGTRS